MKGNIVETLIGAAVIVIAAVFIYFAFSRADVGTVKGYELIAKFERVDGVTIGSDVMIGGIKVGTVVGQDLDTKTYLAVLRLSIRKDVQLPTDSSIKVATAGLLGGSYLAIQPGGEEEFLASGAEFEYTQGAIDITELLGKAIYSVGGDDKGN